jgi:hypothetical protein
VGYRCYFRKIADNSCLFLDLIHAATLFYDYQHFVQDHISHNINILFRIAIM